MKKSILILFFAVFSFFIGNAQVNGLWFDNTGKIQLGENPIHSTASTAYLIYDTYVPLNGYHLWFYDSATPVTNNDKFSIGSGYKLYNPFLNTPALQDAKFNVSNIVDVNTAYISSLSQDAGAGLWVNHSNWLFSSPTSNPPTFPASTNTQCFMGIFSNVCQGAQLENIAIYGRVDSSLAETSIGVKGMVYEDPNMGSSYLNYLNLNNVINIGGNFLTDVSYNNLQNIGVAVRSTSNPNNSTIWPLNNTGIQVNSENADQVFGITCTAIDGLSNNIGLIVTSSSNIPNDIYGAKFFANDGKNSNIGVYSESNSNPSNWTNVAFHGVVSDNQLSSWNIGEILDIDHNSNSVNTQQNDGIFINNHDNYGSNINAGINLIVQDNNSTSISNSAQDNYGVWSRVQNNDGSHKNYGIKAEVSNVGSSTLNYGVWASASGSTASMGNIAIYGDAWNSSSSHSQYAWNGTYATDIAGYFNGDVVVVGDFYAPSDIRLKKNIKPINNSLKNLLTLSTISYNFKCDEFPGMALPEQQQYGLIAQEVFKLYPEIVRNFANPSKIDSSGKEIVQQDFQAINYIAFIPLLIQSFKELKMNNDSLKAQNDSLQFDFDNKYNIIKQQEDSLIRIIEQIQHQTEDFEYTLNECCNKNNSKNINDYYDINSSFNKNQDNLLNEGKTELYQNKPNPFNSITTIYYTIGKTGYVELEISDQLGRLMAKLVSTNNEPGNYSIDWDSNNIKPGIYYYSLKVNNILLVKKAIKIN